MRHQKSIHTHEMFGDNMVNLNKLLADLLQSSLRGDLSTKKNSVKQLNL